MHDSNGLKGAFCLIRLLPMLDTIDSAIKAPVGKVVEALLRGTTVDDEVLIYLDDFRQAAGPQIGFEQAPVSFEVAMCRIAIRATGVEAPFGRPALEAVLSDVKSVWWEIANLATGLGASDVASDLYDQELMWQGYDDQVGEVGAIDSHAIDRYVAQLRAAFTMDGNILSRVALELGWSSTGPCGVGCDWPSCVSNMQNCISRNTFQPQQTLGAMLRRKHGQPARQWFVRVLDFDAADDEPWEIVSEVSAEGFEVRKIVGFISGSRIPVADEYPSAKFPLIDTTFPLIIDMQRAGVAAEELSKDIFEEYWVSATVENRHA